MEQFLEKRSSFNILKKGACCAKPPSPFSGSQQTQTQSMGAWHQHRLLSPEKTCGLFCSGNTNFGKKQKQNTSQSWARVGRFTTARQHLAQKKSWTQFLSDSDKFNPLPRHGPLPLPPKKANKCTPLDLSLSYSVNKSKKDRNVNMNYAQKHIDLYRRTPLTSTCRRPLLLPMNAFFKHRGGMLHSVPMLLHYVKDGSSIL